MQKKQLIIATRESPLALWQANWVKTCLETAHPNLKVTLLGMTTQADRMPYISLAQIGGKGLFVKELEEALLDGRADIAVHSMKDMPMELPAGLHVPVMCARETPFDAFVSEAYFSIETLPPGAIVGTSSLRRRSQLLAWRPDLQVEALRGNVNTRLARLDQGEFAAIILASAGLQRLGMTARVRQMLSPDQFLPAVGQGVLGIECRLNDAETQQLIQPLNDESASICVTAERAMCKRLGGGCQLPIAAYAERRDEELVLRGFVGKVDGSLVLQACHESTFDQADRLGLTVAEDLLNQGAGLILEACRGYT